MGEAGSSGCSHPLCADNAWRWVRVPGVKQARGVCRAHFLEWQYLERLRKARETYRASTPARTLAACGTDAAAKRHRDAGEPVCKACGEAENTRTREARRARKAARAA